MRHFDRSLGHRRRIAAAAFLALSLTAAACAKSSGGEPPQQNPPESQSEHPQPQTSGSSGPSASQSAGPTGEYPTDTAYQFCVAVEPEGGKTILDIALTGIFHPGTYRGAFDVKGDGSVTGTGQAHGFLLEIPVTITQFATYQGLEITGPVGDKVDLRGMDKPIDINSKTDKPNDCHPGDLLPPAGGQPPKSPNQVGADHQAVRDFLPLLQGAIREDNVQDLVGDLNPVVLDRYGAAACERTFRRDGPDSTAAFRFRSFAGGPAPFVYSTDGLSATVGRVYSVIVSATSHGHTSQATLHLAVDGNEKVTFFTDCGTPKGQ